jgi:hypothetical protein
VEKGTALESVSSIYPYAYLYENEMKDLFGIQIQNINLDFAGKLYRTAVKTPFLKIEKAENAGTETNNG